MAKRKAKATDKVSTDNVQLTFGSALAVDEARNVARIIESRGKTHGDALEQHEVLVARWKRIFGDQVNIGKVCMAMIELKLSRMESGDITEIDHFRDIMGYAAIGAAWVRNEGTK